MKQQTSKDAAANELRIFRVLSMTRPAIDTRICHLNGPQAAYEAMALPTYPVTASGVVSVPGGFA